MESIKHKMEELVKNKEDATKLAEELEKDAADLKSQSNTVSSTIDKTEKGINELEMNLDDTMTATIAATEKLEETDKVATDSELQLIEEETKRVNDRLSEVLEKLGEVESNGEENERKRKVLEAQSFSNE